MKIKKLLLSLTTVIICILACTVSAAAAFEATVYDCYSDGVLFQEKITSSIAGTAPAFSTVSLELKNSHGTVVTAANVTAGLDGTYELPFTAPAGGYEAYTINLYCRKLLQTGATLFKTIENVAFGQLWLGSGQSNMTLSLFQADTWQETMNGGCGSVWLRFLVRESAGMIGGTNQAPLLPQENLPGCYWVSGGNYAVGNAGAVDYYFAEKLQQELDMPVGVLCMDMGGSHIACWISRDNIENNETALTFVNNAGLYVPAAAWDDADTNYIWVMTGCYNGIIYPLRRFALAGMIWYQGESDAMQVYGYYGCYLELLQMQMNSLFNHREGTVLPIVLTSLAVYHYQYADLMPMLIHQEMAQFAARAPSCRAMICIGDITPLFTAVSYPIHPVNKKPVGYRFADSALGLVYGKSDTYSAPYLKSSRIENGSVYITFTNTGQGLTCTGGVLRGFSVSGSDGVYYQANAQIVSADTVRVWRDDIPDPKSAAYGFSKLTLQDNLYSTENGEAYLPAVSLMTDMSCYCLYFSETGWTDCDREKIWRLPWPESYTGLYDPWVIYSGSYTVTADAAYEGEGGLRITAEGAVALQQVFYVNTGTEDVRFCECGSNWSKYGSLSFMIRNNALSALTMDYCQINCADGSSLFAPLVGTSDCALTVPADGAWHEIRLDLTRPVTAGGVQQDGGVQYAVRDFVLLFEGTSFDVDMFRFNPYDENDYPTALTAGESEGRLAWQVKGKLPEKASLIIASYDASGKFTGCTCIEVSDRSRTGTEPLTGGKHILYLTDQNNTPLCPCLEI